MKTRNLYTWQEPAKNWWVVSDRNDEEDGVFYGPHADQKISQAFVDGYNRAVEDLESEDY